MRPSHGQVRMKCQHSDANSMEKKNVQDCNHFFFLRFINDLDDADPMKTYYQVSLGKIPAVASVSIY